jgi:hypothetical protein
MQRDTSLPMRRAELRSDVAVSTIQGLAVKTGERDNKPFIIWDISDKGLRLWLPDHVKSADILKLTVAKPFVVILSCEVRWCKPCEDGDGFHVGVRVLDNFQRLEALHREAADADQSFSSAKTAAATRA